MRSAQGISESPEMPTTVAVGQYPGLTQPRVCFTALATRRS